MDKVILTEKEMQKVMSKPLIKHTDMSNEMGLETIEIITMSLDKHLPTHNYESASLSIKNAMDKKFGATWHCVIGEGFGFDVVSQVRFCTYVFYGGTGILCYKC